MTDYVDIPLFSGLGKPLPMSIMNNILGNQQYFRAPPQAHYTVSLAAANYTTTTPEADIDGTNLNFTIVTTGNPVICVLQAGKMGLNASGNVFFELMIDGVDQAGGLGIAVHYMEGSGHYRPLNIILPIFNLSAASHTFRWRWWAATGTVTLYAANLIQSWIREW